jgi:hypothetical protein
MTLAPEHIDDLIRMERLDAGFHQMMAEHWHKAARRVKAEFREPYLAEGDEHLASANRCLAAAIGWASR